MTRRITLAILATLIAALAVVGSGTIVLANVRARATTERELRAQVGDVADRLTEVMAAQPAADEAGLSPEELLRRRLRTTRLVARILSLDDFGVVTITPQGRIVGELLTSVDSGMLDITTLRAGEVRAGRSAGKVVVATALGLPRARLVIIASRRPNAGLGASVRWFVLAAVGTVAVGTVVATALGRRLSRPVREAGMAARRIAAGELSARLAPPRPGEVDELSELTNSINTMAANLQRSRSVEQQFLLSVSHDLRTPLTSIRGYAEAIADGAGDARRSAGVILSESRRLERLVTDLLDLAKVQTRSFTLRPAPIDLAGLARAGVDSVAPAAAARLLRVTCVSPGPMPIVGDPDRVAQIIANLIDNALTYARTTVTVTVARAPDGRDAQLDVDDDGPGIPPDDLGRVFERLFVARNQGERRESGSGIGLAIVAELVSAMGGSVHAADSPLGGARIVVRLPG